MNIKQIKKNDELYESLFKITHEIKNPIAVCKGYLEMLDPKNQQQVEKYIPVIKQEIERTLFLMEDFKNFAHQNMENEKLDVMELLDDCISALKPLFEKKAIKTSFAIVDDEVYVKGDYNKLKQVIINVIKNAIEAVDSKKEKIIKIETYIIGDKLRIAILDSGGGMSEEIKKKIYEPFFTTKANGTGLGLPLSRDIVRKHGGTFEISSKKGSMTKVNLTLPLIN